ncbi:MAG: hypothetical protein JST75_20385 [Bacteroidetes bacterium]|nr:hypothetical protein [Bacteroidota bacterium]
MKKFFLLFAAIVFVIEAHSQQNFNDSTSQARNRLTKNAMTVLGGWSVANIASGFIIAGQTNGEAKYFWRMNAYWNFINLGLAGMGYMSARKMMRLHNGFTENYKAQHSIEKLYVFNAGLDLAYIAGGFYLRERGNRESDPKNQDQFRGYGSSIAVQGGFLLVMDCVMYMLHHKNTKRMDSKLQRLEVTGGLGGIGINYRF